MMYCFYILLVALVRSDFFKLKNKSQKSNFFKKTELCNTLMLNTYKNYTLLDRSLPVDSNDMYFIDTTSKIGNLELLYN